jgi:acyl dehydratase
MADRGIVGKTYPPFTVRVEYGKIREFAEALRDENPLYRDEEAARRSAFGGIIAPPTLSRNFWWEGAQVHHDLGFDWRYVLHGEQEFEYHQPIRAGDLLTAQVKIADRYEKAGKRGGKMTFAVIETEYRNGKGETVLVGRRTLIQTEPPAAEARPGPPAPIRRLTAAEAQEGLESPPMVVGPVSRTDFVRYAGASGDLNPNHHDELYAIRSGNNRVFAMGMLPAGYLAHLLTDWLGDGALRRLRFRFTARVYPGDVLTCRARLTRVTREGQATRVECEAWVKNRECDPSPGKAPGERKCNEDSRENSRGSSPSTLSGAPKEPESPRDQRERREDADRDPR